MFLELKNLIISNPKGKIPDLLFLAIKEKILGKKYSLAINFINAKTAQELNIKYRQKEYTPEILSFPFSKSEGEMMICLSAARIKAKKFSKKNPVNYKDFLILLIIHGCLSLTGKDFENQEENFRADLEEKYLQFFKKINSNSCTFYMSIKNPNSIVL